MDAVKLAVKKERQFCTSLTLHQTPLQEELWQHEVSCLPMGGTSSETPSISMLARRLDLFLDLVLALSCTNTPYVMCHRFDGMRHIGFSLSLLCSD